MCFLSYFCFLWLNQISVQLTESQAISHFCWFRYFFLINESLWNWRRILWFHPVAFEMLPQWHSILPAGICRYNNGLVFGHVFRIYKLWILIEDESKWIWRDSVFFFSPPFSDLSRLDFYTRNPDIYKTCNNLMEMFESFDASANCSAVASLLWATANVQEEMEWRLNPTTLPQALFGWFKVLGMLGETTVEMKPRGSEDPNSHPRVQFWLWVEYTMRQKN